LLKAVYKSTIIVVIVMKNEELRRTSTFGRLTLNFEILIDNVFLNNLLLLQVIVEFIYSKTLISYTKPYCESVSLLLCHGS
jgi:hypothetical protein